MMVPSGTGLLFFQVLVGGPSEVQLLVGGTSGVQVLVGGPSEVQLRPPGPGASVVLLMTLTHS